MRKVQKEISDAKAEYTESAEEVFSNVRTVKAFANEDTETIKFCDKNTFVYYFSWNLLFRKFFKIQFDPFGGLETKLKQQF